MFHFVTSNLFLLLYHRDAKQIILYLYAKERFQINTHLAVCCGLKPVTRIPIIFQVKLLECGRKGGRKGQENKTYSYTRNLLVNSFFLKGRQMVIFIYCT